MGKAFPYLLLPGCIAMLRNLKNGVFLMLGLVLSTSVASADELASKLEAFINQPPYEEAHWGVLFVDQETGETLYEHQRGKLFAPASVTKLYSVAAALDVLGADHRFKTPIYRRGNVDDAGVLHGDLILVPSGDLTLGGRTTESGEIAFKPSDHTYSNWSEDGELTTEDPLAGLNNLAKQVAAAGIRKVDGDVLIDNRLFQPTESSGSGPKLVQPAMLNDNIIDFTITPGKEGEPATVTCRPEAPFVRVTSEVRTTEGGKASIIIRGGAGQFTVSGTIPAGRKPLVRHVEMDMAPSYLRGYLLDSLRRAGVETKYEPALSSSSGNLPTKEEYADLAKVAELESPTMAEEARLVLKVSHNLHASALPILVDLHLGGQGTLSRGLQRQREALERLGVDVDRISFAGGAGGARGDYVTPAATVQLLRGMAKHKDFAAYERALPILGIDGTLARSVGEDSAARGKVLAKTGTLTWDNTLNDRALLQSKALAGYLTTAKGRKLAFAIFVNGVHLKDDVTTKRVGNDLAKICEIVHDAL